MDPSAGLDAAGLGRLLDRIDADYAQHDELSDTLMTVLDTLDGTNCHLDAEGRLKGVSDRGDAYFGLEASELLDAELLERVHIEDEHGVRLTTADLQRDRRIARGRVVRADGSAYTASIAISRIGPDRRHEGSVLLILDVEDRVAEERALHDARVEALAARQAERNSARFLANMSHELRTPLNAILGYSELLLDEATATGERERVDTLTRVTEAGRHLTELIGSILDLAKVEAGKLELVVEDLDLAELVTETVELVRSQVEARGLSLALYVSGPLPLRTDRTRVRQVLYNLLSNAMKFTEQGGITVTVGPGARVEVADTGPGIAPDALPRVFREFEQASPETAARFGGTGLGLPLSRRLCRLLGGDLTATSELEKGSTFVMVLAPLPGAE